ncbi:DELLA protein RGL2-like [Cucumis melo]|uniref:DELLA protein RGL2-like isoform X1 n=1 Tax=Cucumis melo TaxID=3656 RepID=A0A1S3BQZ0_CUCME|nr:DELLA protein RGL2-like [Cucumis melo]UPT51040.1 GRAS protein [Cucumis melo]
MADGFFSFTPFDFSGSQPETFFPSNGGVHEKQETEQHGKEDDCPFRMDEFGDFNFPSANQFGFYQQDISKIVDQTNYQHPNSDCLIFDELLFGNDFTISELIQEKSKISENLSADSISFNSNKQVSNPCLDSLQLLNSYGTKVKRMKGENLNKRGDEAGEENKTLSTEEIFRVAGARYVHFFPEGHDDFYMLTHPCDFALSGLSEDEREDVELANVLFAAAEKVGYQQFDRASRLLQRCEWTASPYGNAVQRLVYYFSKALRKRIQRETGREVIEEQQKEEMNLDVLRGCMKLPFQQVMHLTAVQAILEHVKLINKIHLIDLEIRSGVHWSAFMQSLVDLKELPIKLLKITAVVTNKYYSIDQVGKWLENVAESLNIPFSFKAILVSDMMEIKEELFETEDDEMLAIYCPLVLRNMISRPSSLENLMKVIRNLNPSIMVVSEIEANYNLSSFVNRFIEALFFTASYFDCLKICIEEDEDSRRKMEALCGKGIENIVASEGSDRVARSVKIEVWRAFFARFRMEEMEFSDLCLSQAKLVSKEFPYGKFCSLEKNEKCLVVGWKETPIISVSAWQFL